MSRAALLALLLIGGALMYARQAQAADAPDTADGESEQGGALDFSAAWYGVENMAKGMRMSPEGLKALQEREGLRLHVYMDTAGKQTIGYGHLVGTFEDYSGGITPQEASELLASDVSTAENAVASLVTVPLTQGQFDALVSFVFNTGTTAFKNSTLLKMLNAGDYQAAEEQFVRWVFVTRGGVKVADNGLMNRRASEQNQFAMA